MGTRCPPSDTLQSIDSGEVSLMAGMVSKFKCDVAVEQGHKPRLIDINKVAVDVTLSSTY